MKYFRFRCASANLVLILLLITNVAGQSQVIPADAGPIIFVTAVPYNSGGYDARSLAVADLNGDGKLDVVIASTCPSLCDGSYGPGSVSVLLGNGDGSFQTPTNYLSGGLDASSVAISDVNRDAHLDLVVTSECQTFNGSGNCFEQPGVVSVLLGNGNGTFQPPVAYDSGAFETQSVAVGDLNGDGWPDLVLANREGGASGLLNRGNGTFQPALVYKTDGDWAHSVTLADVNADGRLDILVADICELNCPSGESGISVLLGNGNGTFQDPKFYSSGNPGPLPGTFAVVVADLNGDGKLDVAAASECYSGGCYPVDGVVGVLLGNGDGTFGAPSVYSSGDFWPLGLAVADVNNDHHPDLLVANQGTPTGSATVLLGSGDGTFHSEATYSSAGSDASAVVVADANGDGKPDLFMSSTCGPVSCVGVLLNNFGAPATSTSVQSNLNPANPNKSVTYTATVAGQPGMLNGVVTFRDGGKTVSTAVLANNQATYTTRYAKRQWGQHVITAMYGGEFNVASGSQSAPLTEYIRFATSKTVLATSGSPSHIGQPVTFTATVTSNRGKIPDGETVTFSSGKQILGTDTTKSGLASFTTTFSKAKTYTIKATYSGDNFFEPSAGRVKQVVQP